MRDAVHQFHRKLISLKKSYLRNIKKRNVYQI